MIRVLIPLLFCCAALAQIHLPTLNPSNSPAVSYHATFTFDSVTNAQWYSVIVRSNGIETQRRYSMTNLVTVSNLWFPLDQYRFTAIATNSLGESAESDPAPLHNMSVLEADTLAGPWSLLKTNQFVPSSPQHFIILSNFNAQSLLKPDK